MSMFAVHKCIEQCNPYHNCKLINLIQSGFSYVYLFGMMLTNELAYIKRNTKIHEYITWYYDGCLLLLVVVANNCTLIYTNEEAK